MNPLDGTTQPQIQLFVPDHAHLVIKAAPTACPYRHRPVTTALGTHPGDSNPWESVTSIAGSPQRKSRTRHTPGDIYRWASHVGSQIAAQAAIPPSLPVPAITASSSPASVVYAFLSAVNRQDWPAVWRFGAKNLGIPYGQLAQRLPSTVNAGINITSAAGDKVSALLVAAENDDQAQVYRDIFVVAKGVIIARTQTLVTTGPSEGLFTALAGSWSGHDRGLTISPRGLGIDQVRLFADCTENLSVPCDTLAGNVLFYGGIIVFQLRHESGNGATGFILSSTIAKPDSPVTITFQPDDSIEVATVGTGGPNSYCGTYTLPGYCGA